MNLYIDTTGYDSARFVISEGKKAIKRAYKTDPRKSSEILVCLEKFLKSSKVKISGIKKIYVNKGPGAYTGTRVGSAHALALGFGLDVPVKFISTDKFIRDVERAKRIIR